MQDDSSDKLKAEYSAELLIEAAVWFARIRCADAVNFQAAFERWMGNHSLNRAAYQRVGEIFAVARFLASEGRKRRQSANDNLSDIPSL
ncbi:DUF4880 domain-containing protein [Novosphingobium sp. PhB165]|uniref:DUF4880 domain-containing protein n=1 Tax=Novosphingobium sp. PhB165 TaxID=2485105 RepID=UPI00104D7BD2|nr:DUF4880 domain-containing protein [Novosphingobium sp. PhB165]